MNKERRKKLAKVIESIEGIMAEEQETLDNLPESLEDSDQAETMESTLIRCRGL